MKNSIQPECQRMLRAFFEKALSESTHTLKDL